MGGGEALAQGSSSLWPWGCAGICPSDEAARTASAWQKQAQRGRYHRELGTGSTPPLALNLQFSARPSNACQMSCRTQKSLEIYSVFSSTALFAMFSFQHSTAACLCWPSLPSSLPPHLQAIQAQEIQYYLKYLTKGLNYSLGRRRALPHGYSSRAGWQALRDCELCSELPRATQRSPCSSPVLSL